VVTGLFPEHPLRDLSSWQAWDPPYVTLEELTGAASSLRNNTSPGIDGITNEALKLLVRRQPQILLQTYNNCIKEGFPSPWKRSWLVLIKKGDKPPGEPSSLCLLDCTGKLFEKIIDNHLRDALESNPDNGLSDNQFGFQRGRSTLDALTEVRDFAERSGVSYKVGLLTLDIRNAFNSASWENILMAMRTKDLPHNLCRIIDDYFTDRMLYIQAANETATTINLTSGVPQGSVRGPTLWNILYDRLLHLRLQTGASFLAFADDLAIITRAKDTSELGRTLGIAAQKTAD